MGNKLTKKNSKESIRASMGASLLSSTTLSSLNGARCPVVSIKRHMKTISKKIQARKTSWMESESKLEKPLNSQTRAKVEAMVAMVALSSTLKFLTRIVGDMMRTNRAVVETTVVISGVNGTKNTNRSKMIGVVVVTVTVVVAVVAATAEVASTEEAGVTGGTIITGVVAVVVMAALGRTTVTW